MSNLYKITTGCVTKIIQNEVAQRGPPAENQLGTVAGIEGTKEQALSNIAINCEEKTNLKNKRIDVRKAFDLVNFIYLLNASKN